MRRGDRLTVVELSRLGRSTTQLTALLRDFKDRGIGLRILNLGIDTSTPAGELIFTIVAPGRAGRRPEAHAHATAGRAGDAPSRHHRHDRHRDRRRGRHEPVADVCPHLQDAGRAGEEHMSTNTGVSVKGMRIHQHAAALLLHLPVVHHAYAALPLVVVPALRPSRARDAHPSHAALRAAAVHEVPGPVLGRQFPDNALVLDRLDHHHRLHVPSGP
ncbi:recombinase family protein [Streptomyces polyrhachis]|uniref:Recombinase family protein n=1 Tax=Streptomyces polyrhachis TaxID=1282885 RepID=A0ABW2GLE9_9ACTN